jgi:hypothetical protein
MYNSFAATLKEFEKHARSYHQEMEAIYAFYS